MIELYIFDSGLYLIEDANDRMCRVSIYNVPKSVSFI